MENVILNTKTKVACFNVTVSYNTSVICNSDTDFTVSIGWKNDPKLDYKVDICQMNVTIAVRDDCKYPSRDVGSLVHSFFFLFHSMFHFDHLCRNNFVVSHDNCSHCNMLMDSTS